MKALLAFVAVVLAALAVTVEPARACSCIPPDPWAILPKADGAFVGRLVSRREADQGRAVLTFSVERAVKGKIGKTVEVVTADNGAACGIETAVGARIGLFLLREGGSWHGHLCWQVTAEDLLAAAALPAPNGQGPVRLFVGGDFGPARTLALDAKGRTLGYGIGSGSAQRHAACPGGRRVAELVQRGSGYVVAIRDLPALWLVREQKLEMRKGDTPGVRCLSADGSQLVVFRDSGPNVERRARLLRITPAGTTMIWEGIAWHASLRSRVAYVQVLDLAGTTLTAVDLRRGTTQKLGHIPLHDVFELVPNGAHTRFASRAITKSGRPLLLVVDARRRPASIRAIPIPHALAGDVLWLSGGRLALLQKPTALVFSSDLRVVSRFPWHADDAALVDSKAFGIDRQGRLVSAQLPFGPIRLVRRLPGRPNLIVSATG